MNKTIKILQCDEPSPYTGRIYPREEVERAIANYQEKIDEGVAYGTFDVYNKNINPNEMNIADISHQIVSLSLNEQGEVFATIKILDTPAGTFLQAAGPENFRLSPSMLGTVSDFSTVSDLELFSTSWLLD